MSHLLMSFIFVTTIIFSQNVFCDEPASVSVSIQQFKVPSGKQGRPQLKAIGDHLVGGQKSVQNPIWTAFRKSARRLVLEFSSSAIPYYEVRMLSDGWVQLAFWKSFQFSPAMIKQCSQKKSYLRCPHEEKLPLLVELLLPQISNSSKSGFVEAFELNGPNRIVLDVWPPEGNGQ